MLKRPGNEIAKTAVLAAVIALVGTLYLLAILNAVPPHPDLDIYVRGAKDLLAGRPLYDGYLHNPGDPTLRYGFIYPPVFAIVLLPLSLIPASALPAAWLIATHAALAIAFLLVFRRLKAGRTVTMLAIAVTLAFYPLWVEGSQAQANLLILLLVTLGIVGISDGRAHSGIWIGMAAALKLTPALLIIWLLWERRFRAAAWMGGGLGLFTALGALIRPADSMTYVTKVLPMLAGGTAYYSNQSTAGLLKRLFAVNPYTTPVIQLAWEPILVGVVIAGLLGYWILATRSRALSKGRREPLENRSGFTFLPLLPLASAVSWEHHLVILLPLIWGLIAKVSLASPRPSPQGGGRWETASAQGGRTHWKWIVLAAGLLCLTSIPHLPVGPPYATDFARAAHTANPLLILGANRLLVGTLLLFVATPWLLGQSWQTSSARAVASAWLPWRKRAQLTRASTWSSSELDRPA